MNRSSLIMMQPASLRKLLIACFMVIRSLKTRRRLARVWPAGIARTVRLKACCTSVTIRSEARSRAALSNRFAKPTTARATRDRRRRSSTLCKFSVRATVADLTLAKRVRASAWRLFAPPLLTLRTLRIRRRCYFWRLNVDEDR